MFGRILIFISLLVVAAFPEALMADIYTYTDSGGIVHFTDTKPDKEEVPNFKVFEKTGRTKIAFEMDRSEIERLIHSSASKHGLDKKLVKAIIKAESDFNPKAVSHKGAIGLMQVMPKTAYSMGVDNIRDPRKNVDAGCKLLKTLLKKYKGDIELSLAAYNAGETAVRKYKGIPPYKETINYVQKVIRYYNAMDDKPLLSSI